jgi:hypothetical protein
MFREISRKPILSVAYAVLIWAQTFAEILLRPVRFASGNWAVFPLAHVQMNG